VRPGVLRVVLSGGGVRFRVRLDVPASKPAPTGPAPAPKPVRPPAPLPPPSNGSAPAITGIPWSGQVLTADNGVWRVTGQIEYAYAWQRCDAAGVGCKPIQGATAPRYTVANADVGHSLRIAVTVSNASGSASATSLPTDVVTPAPGVARSPSLPTAAREGQTIHVTPATFTGPAPLTVAFRWQRCTDTCVDVGADQTSYAVATADIGSRLQVVETATWSAKTLVLNSNKTDPVAPATIPIGTVALWHMDDLGATMTDSAGHHDGALHNVATGLPGFAGTAFGFNGASSYANVPAASDLSAVDQDVTLTIRMKATVLPPSTVEDWDLIRSAGGYFDGDEYKMEYYPDGSAHCAFKGNGATGYKEVASTGPPLDDGQWHTIQCVKTATQVQTVVDGVVFAKSAQIGTITITSGIVAGAHSGTDGIGTSEFFNGALDEASLQFSAPG
jgi:Concanavalin A-like lectin/glucanases superfamily